jgi:hypothetical protein
LNAAPILDDLHQLQRRNNRQSASSWEPFAHHREQVTALVAGAGEPGDRAAVLGAGNCNDLDLPALASRFGAIHLIDIDEEALRRARDRQLPATAASLILRAPLDLSGAWVDLSQYRSRRPTAAELSDILVASPERVARALPEKFDVVLSACILSQILHGCGVALGADHPDLGAVREAISLAHLRLLVQLVRPGGRGVLVTDTCSSLLYPSLEERFRRPSPRALLDELEEDGAVLAGTRRSAALAAFASDPVVAPLVGRVRPVEPWLWKMGPLVLLVYAVVFERGLDPVAGDQ